MKHVVFFTSALLMLLQYNPCSGQVMEEVSVSKPDTLVSFPGGDAAFDAFIASNLFTTHAAKTAGISGEVTIRFVIDDKGQAGSFTVIKKLGYGCDEQAIRVLSIMPSWQPGVISGRRISSTLQKSFSFNGTMQSTDPGTEVRRDMLPDMPLQFGEKAGDLEKYIRDHFVYPAGIKGNIKDAIVLQFRVNTDGATGDVQVITGLGETFDKEAVRVIQSMPPWKPKQSGFKPTAAYAELIIGFKKKKPLVYQFQHH